MFDYDAEFEAYLDAEDGYVAADARPADAYDYEAQADLELHEFLHADGYHG